MSSYMKRTDVLQRLKTRELIYQDISGNYPVQGAIGYFVDASGTFGTSTVTIENNVLSVTTDASGNFMTVQDNSGVNHLYSYDGILYYNDTVLGIPTDISNVAAWAEYPAIDTVNMNGNGITGSAYITGGTATLGDVYTAAAQIHLGGNAGQTGQASYAIAIGFGAGMTSQAANTVAIGRQAGDMLQRAGSIAIGFSAGNNGQGGGGGNAVAIGSLTGNNQESYAVAIGNQAGRVTQGVACVAIGNAAGTAGQLTNSVAIGNNAGNQNQGPNCIAIGHLAGNQNQGANSIAIGSQAGVTGQGANSIVLNASSSVFSGTTGGFFVNPVRTRSTTAGASALYIDNVTGEIFRSP